MPQIPQCAATGFGLWNLLKMKPSQLLCPLLISLSAQSGFAEDRPLTVGWANLQWPPATNHIISVTNRTAPIYGQVWIDGLTSQPGATPRLVAQLGFGPAGSNPQNNPQWTWVDASFNLDVGNNDEFMASLLPESTGTFDYLYRYSTTGGSNWLYADLKGPIPNTATGQAPANAGKLVVTPAADTTPPAIPTGLVVSSASPPGITLQWNSQTGDPTLFGYEVLRSAAPGGPYTNIARVTTNTYSDLNTKWAANWFYVVRSVDHSFNRSANSTEVRAGADSSVTVTFNVTVPATTESSGKPVHIAGTLAQLSGGLSDWEPEGARLTRVDANHWTITLRGKEGTQIEYKYTLGSWDNVEKGRNCDEIPNRQLTLRKASDAAQTVNDTVLNWRNIAPCKD
jgi:hypothetical protein